MPEVNLKDKEICVKGRIEEFKGAPQIEAKDPTQIEPEKK